MVLSLENYSRITISKTLQQFSETEMETFVVDDIDNIFAPVTDLLNENEDDVTVPQMSSETPGDVTEEEQV